MARIRSVKPETTHQRWRRGDLDLGGQTALYRAWSRGLLLYVGTSGNLIERWRRHAGTKPWWPAVDLITFEVFDKTHLALAAERATIRSEMPAFNVRSAGR
jgi:hypothetical protein